MNQYPPPPILIFFIFFLFTGNQLVHTDSALQARISPQWLSESKRLPLPVITTNSNRVWVVFYRHVLLSSPMS